MINVYSLSSFLADKAQPKQGLTICPAFLTVAKVRPLYWTTCPPTCPAPLHVISHQIEAAAPIPRLCILLAAEGASTPSRLTPGCPLICHPLQHSQACRPRCFRHCRAASQPGWQHVCVCAEPRALTARSITRPSHGAGSPGHGSSCWFAEPRALTTRIVKARYSADQHDEPQRGELAP